MDPAARAARVRLVLFDVDGVLTDGRVVLHGDGSESKQFHIRDGIVMVWAQRVGLKIGLLSARHSASPQPPEPVVAGLPAGPERLASDRLTAGRRERSELEPASLAHAVSPSI